MSDNTVLPSPLPPWHLPTRTPQTQTLVGEGTISVTMDVTYLNQTEPKTPGDPSDPYMLVLPAGGFKRQIKRLFIPTANVNNHTTAKFQVNGSFAGFGFLIFDDEHWNAVLEWDGEGWHLIGGNAGMGN
jgi:hypothetical protein